MAITVVSGDMFASGIKTLAHGCNCKGVMGAGVAREFRERYPAMHDLYVSLCDKRKLRPGEFMYYTNDDGVAVYNLMTQNSPGPNATYSAIFKSVKAMCEHAESNNRGGMPTQIALPRIGAGIGGLEWEEVRENLLDASAPFTRVELIVHVL